MRRVRNVILAADPRITAIVKYGTVTFVSQRDLAGYVQVADKQEVSVTFNNGAKIAGSYPHLEGTGPNARFMRFVDLAEVNARARSSGGS
jgi:hypothetical protein